MLNYLRTDVEICVNGKPIRKYPHNGRIYIEAKDGIEYSIKIKNNSYARILAVASVDGINAINGEAGGATKAGYVINGRDSYEIKGFRTSNESVNTFKFSDKEKSYAAKSDQTGGDTSNCGVIGVQIYSEKQAPILISPILEPLPWNNDTIRYANCNTTDNHDRPRSANLSYCTTSEVADYASFDLGTEFSNNAVMDKVEDTQFNIGLLTDTFEIYYATRRSLISLGVPLERSAKIAFPKAFPSQFCKPPRS